MLRDEKKFESFEELMNKVRGDVESARSFFELRGEGY
jgi:FAD synthase